ncbi:hypothetical protein QKU48_gp0422 [Fadolivirus algeromassiliense]|jgi:hypothetical protein|uniref:Uncharacterized protein n=1 Tax=Fadolivirus FV1/VV64 TaxID=3070911 RepID=A0A7D3QWX4_9VIRU|nr:hypothetical protein QKU48_gp0422 [Fadolivirus algeromassiliense]QKF93880.1 hypothetical protein Fadolivirus_1_422 [Fadolivirus FV1/VV64]
MENPLFNKRNVIVFLVCLLAVFALVWFMLPKTISITLPGQEAASEVKPEAKTEGFTSEEDLAADKDTDKNLPNVNPKTGSLIDGPGFERGDVEGVTQEVMSMIPSNYYFLDDGNAQNDTVVHNLCSKSCCSAQWPTPFKQKYDPYVCANKDQFVPSNIFCNNSFQDSGLMARSG